MADYKLFSLPNCEKCTEVKDFLKSKNIPYEEFNLGMTAGKKVWGAILRTGYEPKKHDGLYIMPILVKNNGSGIETIVQGPEDTKAIFA